MNAMVVQVFPAVALFVWALALTACSLWMAGRIAPWFLKAQFEPPTLRSFFLEPLADTQMTRARTVTALVAFAILLTAMLSVAVAARVLGWEPSVVLF
jgi:hypothetical protein